MSEAQRETPAPGAELVPWGPAGAGPSLPRSVALAADAAVGAAARTTQLAVRAGGAGWHAAGSVARTAARLPGVEVAGRLTETALRPLADDGRRARGRAAALVQDSTQRLIDALVPQVVDAIDVDRLVQRIDIDALVSRIEIDELVRRIEIDALVARIDIDRLVSQIDIDHLVSRIDIDRLVRRIEIDAVVARIDIDRLVSQIDIDRVVSRIDIDEVVRHIEMDAVVSRIDMNALMSRVDVDAIVDGVDIDAVVDRIDVNEVVQRVDIESIIEETELGTIVARSTTGFAGEALDSARDQTVSVDTLLNRVVNRLMRRDESEMPSGPPLLQSLRDEVGATLAETLPNEDTPA